MAAGASPLPAGHTPWPVLEPDAEGSSSLAGMGTPAAGSGQLLLSASSLPLYHSQLNHQSSLPFTPGGDAGARCPRFSDHLGSRTPAAFKPDPGLQLASLGHKSFGSAEQHGSSALAVARLASRVGGLEAQVAQLSKEREEALAAVQASKQVSRLVKGTFLEAWKGWDTSPRSRCCFLARMVAWRWSLKGPHMP